MARVTNSWAGVKIPGSRQLADDLQIWLGHMLGTNQQVMLNGAHRRIGIGEGSPSGVTAYTRVKVYYIAKNYTVTIHSHDWRGRIDWR